MSARGRDGTRPLLEFVAAAASRRVRSLASCKETILLVVAEIPEEAYESFEIEGFWWHPDQPERKVPGKMVFDPLRGTIVHLTSPLMPPKGTIPLGGTTQHS